mgnify:CR=1 FL=1
MMELENYHAFHFVGLGGVGVGGVECVRLPES